MILRHLRILYYFLDQEEIFKVLFLQFLGAVYCREPSQMLRPFVVVF